MTDSANEDREADVRSAPEEGGVPFVERDAFATRMTYGTGKLPAFVMLVWVVAIVGFAAYFISYGMPDLAAWGAP